MIRLRSRERTLILAMAGLAVVLGLYGFLARPMLAEIRTLQRTLPDRQQELKNLTAKTRQIALLSSQSATIRQAVEAQPDTELLPGIESVITRQGLLTHLKTLSPRSAEAHAGYGQTVVEVTVEKLGLKQVLDLLQEIQTRIPLVRIGSLHLSRHPSEAHLLNLTALLTLPRVTEERPASGS